MVADDNNGNYVDIAKAPVTLIQIPNEVCKEAGFFNMTMTLKREITAWDKAIYYFSTIQTSYEHVWFIEEDVFFHNEQTLRNIDKANKTADLLTNRLAENRTGGRTDWHWPKVKIEGIPPPYYSCMCCASRISRRLLDKIKEYAAAHKTLFFLEAMFPTLCKYNKFINENPREMLTIVYRRNSGQRIINKSGLFHPVKDLAQHEKFRAHLSH